MFDNPIQRKPSAIQFKEDMDVVVNFIREAIFRSELPPGTLIHEDAIRVQTGSSVRAVKSALQLLAKEGVVRRKRHLGTCVSEKMPSASCVVLPPVRAISVLSSLTVEEIQQGHFSSKVMAGIRSALTAPALLCEYFNPIALPKSLDDVPVLDAVELKRKFQGVVSVEANNSNTLNELVRQGVPVVAVDFTTPEALFDAVGVDHQHAGFAVTRHLQDLGHKKIGYIGESSKSYSKDPCWQQRLAGYYLAMAEREENTAQHLVVNVDRSSSLVSRELPKFHKVQESSAYVLASGALFEATLKTLTEMGLRCPEDVSLVAADNELATWEDKLLTRMYVDYQQLGKMAVQMLASRLSCRPMPPVRYVMNERLEIGNWARRNVR